MLYNNALRYVFQFVRTINRHLYYESYKKKYISNMQILLLVGSP